MYKMQCIFYPENFTKIATNQFTNIFWLYNFDVQTVN
jgi:hypothetical protein